VAKTDQAVVIGIRTYPSMGSLRGPCRDAEEFRKWLLRTDGGDVPENNIHFLITDDFPNPDETDHPWANDIERLFRPLADKGLELVHGRESLGRRLYIYMAGHGCSQSGQMDEVALLAADAGSAVSPNVAATRWAKWFRTNAVFDEIVLIMDCCRTTNPFFTMSVPPVGPTGSGRRNKVKTFYAFATCDGAAAREAERPDGTWAGIFTDALIEAFDSAVADENGRVNGSAVANYVHQKIGEKQTPEFDVKHRKEILFAQRDTVSTKQVPIRLEPFAGGETVVIQDHAKKEQKRLTPDTASFEVPLEAGIYKAIVENTARHQLFEVPTDEIVL